MFTWTLIGIKQEENADHNLKHLKLETVILNRVNQEKKEVFPSTWVVYVREARKGAI